MAKKIIIIGASGTIGRPTTAKFKELGYEVITVGRNSGDVRANLLDSNSIKAMFEQTGKVDALLNLGGEAPFATIEEVTDQQVDDLADAARGTINLVRYGLNYLNDGGVFVMTTGSTVLDPIPAAAVTTFLGAGVNGFVRAAALSLPREQRINCVLPPLVKETAEMMGVPGEWIPSAEVANWYVEAVEDARNGQWRDQTGWTAFGSGDLGWEADTDQFEKA
ncbi:short chain dehydrogenase [Ruegeria halocynthiae]|uniref:short chain dehydrogenase n=1 Tax=Ruegeria halocynthiae TaxID=985054 RepID=UPI0006912478|nr:short chain dehydrogenase [Ruegeria halocynthiae]